MHTTGEDSTMVRCDRCRARLAGLEESDPYYRYDVGYRMPDRNGHAEYRMRDDSVYLCNARRWPR